MSRLIYTMFFLSILVNTGYSQLPEFSKIYSEHYANFYAVEQLNSSGYILCGTQSSVNDSFSVVKVNLLGKIEWKRVFPFKWFTSRKFSVVLDTNSVVTIWQDSSRNKMRLTALDSDGYELWDKTSQIITEAYLVKTILFEGNIIVLSRTTENKILVVCFDSTGNLLWQSSPSVDFVSSITDGIVLPDSSFFISTNLGIIKLDKSGNHLFTKNFTGVYDLSVAEPGYVIGRTYTSVVKFDLEANQVWTKPFTSNPAVSLIYSPTGFYFAGRNNSTIMKLDTSGTIVSETPARRKAKSLNVAADNGILIASDLFAAKTDENGESHVIDLLAPNGGEQIFSNVDYYIHWYKTQSGFVNIEYSTNAGESWNRVINFYPSNGYFLWDVPEVNSDSCLIRVTNSANPLSYDISDNPFSIYTIAITTSYEYIAANEILMWIGNNGDGSHDPNTDGNGFYWPGGINNSGKSAVFQDGLVWGCKVNGEILVNGNTHRQGLRPGNILTNGSPADPLDPKFRIYRVKKNWEYLPPSPERDKFEFSYLNWPVDLGAPWIDINNDSIYTPGIDQPDYIGDEVLFYAANDLDSNTTSFTYGSKPIGLEFQTTVFGFSNEPLKNVVFKKYLIINKGTYNVTDLFFGYWSDDDLGDANDDFSGVDTILSMAYTYNGDDNDGIYGSPVPAIGHMILQGPKRESAPDDSAFFKGRWVRGFKNVPATSFVMYIGGDATYRDPTQGVYSGSLELYNYLNGKVWNGNSFIDPHTAQPVKFILSGDPVSGIGWYEGPGWPGGKPASDRRGLISVGPVTIAPGDTQEVVIAILINQGTDRLNSISVLRQDAQLYRDQYYNNFPVAVKNEEGLIPDAFALSQNYPNPFNPSTKIKFSIPAVSQVTLKVYDILGREAAVLVNKEMLPGSYEVDFNGAGLASGVYFYRIEAGGFVSTKKMVILK